MDIPFLQYPIPRDSLVNNSDYLDVIKYLFKISETPTVNDIKKNVSSILKINQCYTDMVVPYIVGKLELPVTLNHKIWGVTDIICGGFKINNSNIGLHITMNRTPGCLYIYIKNYIFDESFSERIKIFDSGNKLCVYKEYGGVNTIDVEYGSIEYDNLLHLNSILHKL